MNNQQKLSVIIPVYNEEKTIQSILDRILAVDLKYNISLELILVNDCSTDRSAEVIEGYLNNHPNICRHVKKGTGTVGGIIAEPCLSKFYVAMGPICTTNWKTFEL